MPGFARARRRAGRVGRAQRERRRRRARAVNATTNPGRRSASVAGDPFTETAVRGADRHDELAAVELPHDDARAARTAWTIPVPLRTGPRRAASSWLSLGLASPDAPQAGAAAERERERRDRRRPPSIHRAIPEPSWRASFHARG